MYNWKRNHATMHIKNRICTILTNSCSSSVDSSVSKSSASSRSQNDQTTSNDKQVYTVYIYIYFFFHKVFASKLVPGAREKTSEMNIKDHIIGKLLLLSISLLHVTVLNSWCPKYSAMGKEPFVCTNLPKQKERHVKSARIPKKTQHGSNRSLEKKKWK